MQLAQTLAVLVDAQNLYYSYRRQFNGRVDYGKLLERVSMGRPVVRAIAYVICSPETDATNFVTALKQMGFEVRIKPLKVRPDGSVKGDWDMGIALDAMAIGAKVDTVCLVTGDSDFADLANALRSRGVRVESFGVRGSFADELQRASDASYYIDEDLLRPLPARFHDSGNGAKGNGDACAGGPEESDSEPETEPSSAPQKTISSLRGVTNVPRHTDPRS